MSPLTMEILFARVSAGETVTAVCEEEGFPSRDQLYMMLSADKELARRYSTAMSLHADALFDEVLKVAKTETDMFRAKLVTDALKWRAGKLNPKRYSDKYHMKHDHEHKGGVTFNVVDRFVERPPDNDSK